VGGRSYRRSPADLAQVLSRTDSVSAVAEHYGVPRHTASSWVRTLRGNEAKRGA
jgi:transposase-like protein